MPYDTPSGLAWLGTDLIVANQAYLDQNTANMALLNLAADEPGGPPTFRRGPGSHPLTDRTVPRMRGSAGVHARPGVGACASPTPQ